MWKSRGAHARVGQRLVAVLLGLGRGVLAAVVVPIERCGSRTVGGGAVQQDGQHADEGRPTTGSDTLR